MASDIEQHAGVQRVVAAMAEAGVDIDVRVMDEPTPTALAAATLLGVDVGCIANSLIFRGRHFEKGDYPLLILASGAERIDPDEVRRATSWQLHRADAAYVKEATGFTIGGVAPVGHPQRIITFLDEELMAYDKVWAAAGHVHTMFAISPAELQRVTGAYVIPVRPH